MPETPETTRGPYSFVIGEYLPGTKYVLRKQLGLGGMGVVFEVVKHPHLVGVAKMMLPEYARNPEMVARFEREISILAKLSHPNIVRVKDCESLSDGTPFFVMEKVEGTSLRAFLHDMPAPPPKMIYQIMKGLLEGLHCIHEKGIVHRDIKPENIVLDAPEYGMPGVKLIDFGIADDATSVHVPGAVIGTTSYLAREQLLGAKATPQTDIYAAAVVLYEMIARVRPFDYARGKGEEAFRAEVKDLAVPAPRLRLYAPWIPDDIEKAIMAALSKEPTERPETAYRFLVDIANIDTAEFELRPVAEMNTTEPEFTTAIESAARAMDGKVETTARFDLAPPVEGSVPELAPEELLRELKAVDIARGAELTRSAPDGASALRAPKNGTAPLGVVAGLPAPRRAEASRSPAPEPAIEVSANGLVAHTLTTKPKPRRREVPGYVAMVLSMTLSLGAFAMWRAHGQASASPIAAVAPRASVSDMATATAAPVAPSAPLLSARAVVAPAPTATMTVRAETPAASASAAFSVVERVASIAPPPAKAAPHTPVAAPSSTTVRGRQAAPPKASSERDDSLDDLLALPRTARRPGAGQ